MRALDTNLLVYAHREECGQHKIAKKILREMCEGSAPWALPWPCVYEFLRVVTHARVLQPPTSLEIAWSNVEQLFRSPTLVLLQETDRHPAILKNLILRTRISGNLIHDAHIAALLIEHGVREIVTADVDFRRFEELEVVNPF